MNKFYTVAITLTIIVVGYHAAAGFACLYLTTPAITNQEDCDTTQTSNGRTWCMILIDSEPAGKLPVPDMGERTNPQETVDSKEVQ